MSRGCCVTVLCALSATLCFPPLSSVDASAGEVLQKVDAVSNCIGLYQAGAATISLEEGLVYELVVTGNAAANPWEDSQYDGIFIFYYADGASHHPVTAYVEKGDIYEFSPAAGLFHAFIVDKGLKDVPDNTGSMLLTFTSGGRVRETLEVDAVFNCLGLEDFGAVRNVDVPPDSLCTLSIESGDAVTNGEPDGAYEGVLIFTRDRERPVHPLLLELGYGEESQFQVHATSWVYMFLVDESYQAIGNNLGTITVRMDYVPATPVEPRSWTSVKSAYR